MKALFVCVLSSLFFTACVSNTTPRPDFPSISLQQAKNQPEKFRGKKVYWGGTILNVHNFKNYSEIEILRRPLSGSEPDDRKRGSGRFLAKVSGFIDPAEYKSPSRVTVTGKLAGIKKRKVGEYLYTYPYVKAEKIQFFRGKKPKPIKDPYWWDQPYYRPFPYHSYPYYWSPHGHGYYW